MERSGILHVNPSADLLPKGEDSIKRTLGITEGIYNIFGKHYENKLKDSEARLGNLKADKAQRTLEGEVGATNAKNNADTQYYPQMQQAKLGGEQAKIKEIMARTGLSYAQSKVAMAHLPLLQAQTAKENRSEAGEGGRHAQLFNAYQNAAPGTPQKAYYGALLNKEMGAFAPGGVDTANARVPGQPAGGMVPTAGGMEDNPAGSKRGAKQYFMQGSGETGEAPTTAKMTANQTRIESKSEIDKLYPQVMKNLKPYQGPMGSLKLAKDSALASAGDKKAMKRLEDFATAKRFLPELANINARQSSGAAPGIEMNREFMNSMFPGLPGETASYLIPGEAQAGANQQYLPMQTQAVDQAIKQERTGYLQNNGRPQWAGQGGSPESRGGFSAYGYENPKADVAQGFNGNPNVVPENLQQQQTPAQTSQEQNIYYDEMAAKAIARGVPKEEVEKRLAQLRSKGGR